MSQPNENTLLKAALEYHQCGWCIFPVVHGTKKKPCIKWKKYQQQRPDENTIRGWFNGGKKNIAVVFGKVSGGLACRDFDTMPEYELWAGNHPDLAKILPTVQTARGRHVYFEQKQVEGSKKVSAGELKCSKCYCLLPPSLHPSGSIYQWLIPPNDELPELSLKDFDIADFTEETEEVEETEEPDDSEDIEAIKIASVSSVSSGSSVSSVSSVNDSVIVFENLDVKVKNYVNTAIKCTRPNKEGYRNFLIFQFCRWLKGNAEFEKCQAGQLKPLVRLWHEKALPTIGTKPFDETWADFCYGWTRVKYPKGSGELKIAVEKALNAQKNLAAEELYEISEVKLLVRVCYELQALRKTEPFWLSWNDAALILGVTKPTVGKWLSMLEADGVIKKVAEYTAKRAVRYKFIAK